MRHTCTLSFAFLLAVAAVQARASAQPAAEATVDAVSLRADDLAHKGNDLALKDKWPEAEALFKEAWALKQSYDIGGNLGIAEFAQGKFRDAAEHLSFALAHFPANGKAEHRELLQEKLAKAREAVGARTIVVDVAGAEVLVDGVTIGTAPLPREVFLTPGTRTVEARLAGYDGAKRTLHVAAGSSDRLEFELHPTAPTARAWKPGPALIIPAGVLAVGGLALGTGFTIAANGKASDAATLVGQLGGARSACSSPSAGAAANCTALHNAVASNGTSSNIALGGFVVGGAFALVTGGLLVWAAPWSKGAPVRLAPAVGRGESGLMMQGAW
jgi:hypothetical protein